MNRRSFLSTMLAACAAPAIVRADSLMRIVPRDALVFHPNAFSLVAPPIGRPFLTIDEITREALAILVRNIEADVLSGSYLFGGNNRLTTEFAERKFRTTGGLLAQKNRKPA